jgi:hypothetical protein
MEKINVILPENSKELVILQGKALDPQAPINIEIKGIINTTFDFLSKRVLETNQKKSHILIDREAGSILLIVEETDPLKYGTVTGKITQTDEFKKFKINSGESWTCFDLADFIKMNRNFFESKDVAGKLVTQLRDFKAKIERDVELKKDDKANYTSKKVQAVNSNLPDGFSINVKIFKGMDKVNIPIEINIHPDTLNCILSSPDANDYIQNIVDATIDDQIKQIREIAPDIAIIEQ